MNKEIELKEEAPQIAMSISALSLIIGFAGQVMFYEQGLGLNALLFTLFFLGGLFGLLSSYRQLAPTLNWFFVLPMSLFGFFLSWRSNIETVLLNLLMLGGAGFLLSRFVLHPRLMGGDWRAVLVAGLEGTIAEWFLGPLEIMVGTGRWLKEAEMNSQQAARAQAILRGLLISLPILLVFGALLASADVVFGDVLEGAFSWLDLPSFVGRVILLLLFAWLCVVGYKMALLGGFSKLQGGELPAELPPKFRLGMIEAGMVLGSVDALFLLFVLIQARYFFGGEANLEDYTYAEYARRGFFELLAVSLMTLVLVWGLDIFTRRQTPGQQTLFRLLSTGMILMTGVMLVSAFQRLSLYEEAFGYTRLRVMSHAFTIWLAVLFLILGVDIWRQKTRWFWAGLVLVAMGYVLSLNLLNVDAFIAHHNVERFAETEKIDINYLVDLSDDAIPNIVPLLESENLSSGDRTILRQAMGWRLYELDQKKETVFSLNFARKRAADALEAHREDLKDFYAPAPAWYQRY